MAKKKWWRIARCGYSLYQVPIVAVVAIMLQFGCTLQFSRANPLTSLYVFSGDSGTGDNVDGIGPRGNMVMLADGSLVGMCEAGGTNGTGTIYKLTPGAVSGQYTFSTLYSFSATESGGINSDGATPKSGVILGTDGNIYGETDSGGTNGTGTIFSLVPDSSSTGYTLTTIYTFSALAAGINSDGAVPNLINEGSDGNFYGTAQSGGANGNGTLFELAQSSSSSTGWEFTTLYSFSAFVKRGANFDGANPRAALTLMPNGTFYGTAHNGGANGIGVIFLLIPPSGNSSALYVKEYDFGSAPSQSDGGEPNTPLTLGSEGNLYGTTSYSGPYNRGTIFDFDPNTIPQGFQDIYVLHDPPNPNNAYGMVADSTGSFYGTLDAGGVFSDGVAYKISPAGRYIPLHVFGPNYQYKNSDGVTASSPLLLAPNAYLYGSTLAGGANGNGTIYRLPTSNPIPGIVWQNESTGDVYDWQMTYSTQNGYKLKSYNKVANVADLNWQIQATPDINSDGVPDLIWRHLKDGDIYYWIMSGDPANGYLLDNYQFFETYPDIRWNIGAASDDASMLIWDDGATGNVEQWAMQYAVGGTAGSFVYGTSKNVFPYDSQVTPTETTDWHVVAAPDINGDGFPDLIWENYSTGLVYAWLSTGPNWTTYVPVGQVADIDWHIVGAKDITGAGVPDLLWQNSRTGDVYYWIMTYDPVAGYVLSSYAFVANEDPVWRIAGFGY